MATIRRTPAQRSEPALRDMINRGVSGDFQRGGTGEGGECRLAADSAALWMVVSVNPPTLAGRCNCAGRGVLAEQVTQVNDTDHIVEPM